MSDDQACGKSLLHTVLSNVKSDAQRQLAGWVVKTGRSGVYYLHQDSSLVVQNLGAARVAMQVLSRASEGSLTSTDHGAEEDHEDEEKYELLSLCSCFALALMGWLVSCTTKYRL